jgi:hypothetical protein
MAEMIGSYPWSEKTNGLLSRRDKAAMFTMLVRAQVRELLGRVAAVSGSHRRKRAGLSLDNVVVPDTAMVREAEHEARQLYSQALWSHCQRTYAFAMLLGQFHGIRPDNERLYLGCLFHDYGLTTAHASASENGGFELVGARCAHGFAHAHDCGREESVALYESISLHLNPYLSFNANEPEAVLLQRGATLDVIGSDRHLIPQQELVRVHRRHPREGFREAILATMRDIRHPPDSRAGFLFGCGFAAMAGENPLDGIVEGAA